MHLIFHYMKRLKGRIAYSVTLKAIGTWSELMIPYILAFVIDDVVPQGAIYKILGWGLCMIVLALFSRTTNVMANRSATYVGRKCALELRHDLFERSLDLSGSQFDGVTLPSLISRMTSDSYNVQDFMVSSQAMGIRAPVMLIVGIIMTMIMDPVLSAILCIMVPILGVTIFLVMRYGVPLYDQVQRSIDRVVRILRENITGIRVVKALSREDYERARFHEANYKLAEDDVRASVTMAMPSPIMQLALNIGLSLVVLVGAFRVNSGKVQPGVILAFLTYFNMILQGVLSLNRIFMMASKATASANRISAVMNLEDDQPILELPERETDGHILFDHVSFSYNKTGEMCLSDISFSIAKGESLGIIGATGSGKTSIVNLLMRFYDCDSGGVYISGRDVRSLDREVLRKKFGVVFQNDMIFNDTLYENISFGRNLEPEKVQRAARTANIADYIESLPEGYDYRADIKGANLSGGQKQRILVARAVADSPEILVLDDSSSALDYKTDAALRRAIQTDYGDSTLIMVAQRVSSVMKLDHVLVLENGRMIGYGTHEELLDACPVYRQIYQSQMGDIA